MAAELWRHENPKSTQMWKFIEHVNTKYGLKLVDYPSLYRWSVDNVASFWEEVWDFTGIKSSRRFDTVRNGSNPSRPPPPPVALNNFPIPAPPTLICHRTTPILDLSVLPCPMPAKTCPGPPR